MKRTLLCLVLVAVGPWAATGAGNPSTEILWDRWGVPHIDAPDEPSLFKAYGWAQMHNHGRLLLHQYALGRGRAAEIFGEKDLASDRSVRLMGTYARAKEWYQQLDPRFRADLDAFARGINLYGQGPGNGLDEASRKVLPVDGVDVIAHATRVMWHFLKNVSYLKSNVSDMSAFGSNGWAIAPSHSANGHTMLLANPHLPWSGEFTWIEAQLQCPGYSGYGGSLVGLPVLTIAFNETHGWTHTVNTVNPVTAYKLVPDGQGYLFEGKHRDFERRVERVKILQPDGGFRTEDYIVRTALQGPVVEDSGRLLAVRVAGLQCGSFGGFLEQEWAMGKAGSLGEFQAALKRMQFPMMNTIYADADGNILLFFGGLVPNKGGGGFDFWTHAVPGDSAGMVWKDFMDYDSLPKAVNPKVGWVQNSNSVPWYMTQPMLDWLKFPTEMAPPLGYPSTREQRGIRMISQEAPLSFDQMVADKFSTHSELADQVLDDLLKAAEARGGKTLRKAVKVLETWDRSMDNDSRGAVLFEDWAYKSFLTGWNYSVNFDPAHVLSTPRGLSNPATAAKDLETYAQEVDKKYGRMDIPWGEVYRFRRGKYDFPGNGGPGQLGLFRVSKFDFHEGKTVLEEGDGFIAAVEFSKPLQAEVLLAYGNSSDPDSPHYGDQLELNSQKKLRPALFYRKDVEENTVERSVVP